MKPRARDGPTDATSDPSPSGPCLAVAAQYTTLVRIDAATLPYETDEVQIKQFARLPAILLTRTAVPLGTRPAELSVFYESLAEVLGSLPCADLDLVLDARLAMGRNDAAFEASQAEFRSRVVSRFRACVAVVKLSVARLQVARYDRGRAEVLAVVGSLEEAERVIRADRSRDRTG
ncbi:MAG: hypothetical protein IAG13_12095 [Deltaproteobacteria bacterium]|nr:hypothetical protein [Nannocystaceae bacterium]